MTKHWILLLEIQMIQVSSHLGISLGFFLNMTCFDFWLTYYQLFKKIGETTRLLKQLFFDFWKAVWVSCQKLGRRIFWSLHSNTEISQKLANYFLSILIWKLIGWAVMPEFFFLFVLTCMLRRSATLAVSHEVLKMKNKLIESWK